MAPGLGTRGWDQQALLFRCFACARQRWQPAASRATFLRASESNVRQWRLALGHAVGTSRPCCFAVSHAPGKGGSRQLPKRDQQALLFRCFACARQRWQPAASRATFLRASESNVRQWRLALGHAVGTSRPCCFAPLPEARSVPQGPAVSLFRMRRLWASAAGRQLDFLVGSESDVRQWGPLPGGPVRPSGPCCFAVSDAPFVSCGGWKTARFSCRVRKWR